MSNMTNCLVVNLIIEDAAYNDRTIVVDSAELSENKWLARLDFTWVKWLLLALCKWCKVFKTATLRLILPDHT